MNFIKSRLYCLAIVLTVILSLRFSYTVPEESKWSIYSSDLLENIKMLRAAAQDHLDGRASIGGLRSKLTETRLSYKRVEFLLEYFYPEYVEEYINGAPLKRIERHDTRPFVIPPEGLQVLDEFLFADESGIEPREVFKLTQKLEERGLPLLNDLSAKAIDGSLLITAARLELIRIMSMGVTGFDTPGSLNAIAEASAALSSMHSILKPQMDSSSSQLFTASISFLKTNTSFDDLDRLEFLRNYLDPLYKSLGRLNSENPSSNPEKYQGKMAWNPNSTSMFSEDFLDPYHFTRLDKAGDNQWKRKLGRKLFYEPSLSQGGRLSCSSCHQPEKGFADGMAKSKSIDDDVLLNRNSPTLLNAVYADRYFHDMRAFDLEQQAEHVIFNPHEFNSASMDIVQRINQDGGYDSLIAKATGRHELNRKDLLEALTSYVLSLRSFNSPFDQYIRGDTSYIDPAVKRGFNLFMGKASCGSCHFAPTFSGLVPPRYIKNESEVLGVLRDPNGSRKEIDSDNGRVANKLFSESADIYNKSFKTPTVRNVELTAPYFHNGAYENLDQVIDFYDHGGAAGLGLDIPNQTLAPDSLNLTEVEKADLIAFMNSLTDNPSSLSNEY